MLDVQLSPLFTGPGVEGFYCLFITFYGVTDSAATMLMKFEGKITRIWSFWIELYFNQTMPDPLPR